MKQRKSLDTSFRHPKVYALYKKLLASHGPQYWWPAGTSYEVIIGAILTQNTSWTNVEKAIHNLKDKGLLHPKKILELNKTQLANLIRSSGYYNQKAERLRKVTRAFLKIKNKANKLGILELRNYFLSVKGIGNETADSIVLYAFNKRTFVIDAYTKRFCKAECDLILKEYDEYKDYFESSLPDSLKVYQEYHALIVEWGKRNLGRK